MRAKIIYLMVIGILFSCSTDNSIDTTIEAGLIGQWKLTELLADIGDGQGQFRPIESTKTIEFKDNGIIMTNSSLCDPYSDEVINLGTYDLNNNTISTNCQDSNISSINFELEDGKLILRFMSIEGYAHKFEKIK